MRFEAARLRCLVAIDVRLVQIGVLKTEARVAKLTDSHGATIASFLDAAASGLATVKVDVQAATTFEQLKAACSTIVPDYRIYVLRTPQVHLAIGFDLNDVAVVQLTKAADALQKAIDDVNAHVGPVEQIKRFEILDHDLSQETGELTPTLKVKRNVVHEKFADVVDRIYDAPR